MSINGEKCYSSDRMLIINGQICPLYLSICHEKYVASV